MKKIRICSNCVFRWKSVAPPIDNSSPCYPSPCGPNSQCKDNNGVPICSCLPGFVGSAPACRPECVVSSECAFDKACIQQKCKDPCPGVCGSNAECRVNNHSPICYCRPGYTGNPFTVCNPSPRMSTAPIESNFKALNVDFPFVVALAQQDYPVVEHQNPCVPSPCGPNARCEPINNSPSCACLPTFFGSPPNCRPECTINAECQSSKACIRNRCVDPCPGSCGTNARCDTFNHIPVCTCYDGYTGNAFSHCNPAPQISNYLRKHI